MLAIKLYAVRLPYGVQADEADLPKERSLLSNQMSGLVVNIAKKVQTL